MLRCEIQAYLDNKNIFIMDCNTGETISVSSKQLITAVILKKAYVNNLSIHDNYAIIHFKDDNIKLSYKGIDTVIRDKIKNRHNKHKRTSRIPIANIISTNEQLLKDKELEREKKKKELETSLAKLSKISMAPLNLRERREELEKQNQINEENKNINKTLRKSKRNRYGIYATPVLDGNHKINRCEPNIDFDY